nr:Ribosomal protein [Ipomoea batatas]
MVLATAMAVSGTVVLLACRLQRSSIHLPETSSSSPLLRPCISSVTVLHINEMTELHKEKGRMTKTTRWQRSVEKFRKGGVVKGPNSDLFSSATVPLVWRRRHGVVYVICSANPKHKQRQGFIAYAYEGPISTMSLVITPKQEKTPLGFGISSSSPSLISENGEASMNPWRRKGMAPVNLLNPATKHSILRAL